MTFVDPSWISSRNSVRPRKVNLLAACRVVSHVVQWSTKLRQFGPLTSTDRRRRAATKDRRRHTETLGTQYGQSTCPVARKKRPIISTDLSQTSPIRRRMPTQRIIIATQSSSCSTSDDEDDDASESDAYEGASQTMISFAVTDVEALKKFYITRFIQMQQIPCKMINKAWIKVVQPKKQARHPYNGGKENKDLGKKDAGERTKPDWWPPVGCRHKEPDHIQKPGMYRISPIPAYILAYHVQSAWCSQYTFSAISTVTMVATAMPSLLRC